MSSLLAFDVVTTDLKKLESNLKKEISDKFNIVWDEKPYEVEVNWKSYYKLYGVGETSKSKSTRRCLDNYRTYKKELGESTTYVVGL